MIVSDYFLLCFAVGTLWSLASVVLGGFHLGHNHLGHVGSSAHHGGGSHSSGSHGHHSHPAAANHPTWLASLVHPSSAAAFFAWFGGVGYVLTRHTGWRFWTDIAVALLAGCAGAWLLAAFLRLLQSQDRPLDPADYQMVGVLGRVSCPIRPNGVGEVIFLRDGARRPVPARSEDGSPIGRSEEVIVTSYAGGVASVRTWAAMVPQSPASGPEREALQKEAKHVQ